MPTQPMPTLAPRGPHARARLASIRLAALASVACAVGLWGAKVAMAATPQSGPVHPHAIESPHYGDVVFHFLQGEHFDAISALMVSQHFDRLSPHDDQAELLRGGMLLSYGLHRDASAIFARLIDRVDTPDAVRDRAWFHVAQARHGRGLTSQALDALARVRHKLPVGQQEARELLHAQLLLEQGDHQGAIQALKAMPERDTTGARYARFNLGVAQIQSGDVDTGTVTLDELGQLEADGDEQKALRDRTNVALGFATLRAQQPAKARRYLERVSLDGAESNKALLAYGWSALDLRAPQFALVPWLKLAERQSLDAAGLESRIAVPYAYAQLGARGRALQHYATAIRAYTGIQQDLDKAVADIQSGQFVSSLLDINPRGGWGEGWHMDQWPDVPHAALLTPMLARNDFQEAFKNLRDLRQLGGRLQAWRAKIDAFRNMLDTRRQAFEARRTQADSPVASARLQALRDRLDALASATQGAEQAGDGVALADARQRDLLLRLTRAQAAAQTLGDGPEAMQAQDRLRLLSGVLGWELAQALPERLWQVQSALQDATQQWQQATGRQQAVQLAMQTEPLRLDGLAERIDVLAARIDDTLPRLAALSADQQTAVQDIAVAALAQQKAALDGYLAQARFAVAQLLDQAAQDDTGTPRPMAAVTVGRTAEEVQPVARPAAHPPAEVPHAP